MKRRHFIGLAAATAATAFLPRRATGAGASIYVGPGESRKLGSLTEVTGNVVVDGGTLTIPPGGTLKFVNVDESAYVGGGLEILDSDVGLWVTNGGKLVARDASIEGEENHRAHVIFLEEVAIPELNGLHMQWLGPQQEGDVVLGRWPLHFHHNHESLRGLVIEDVLAEDCGSFAFVAHLAHGITFRRFTARRCFGAPFWYDRRDETHDHVWEDCLAEDIYPVPSEPFNSAYLMGVGEGNVIRNCVARRVHTQSPTGHFDSQSGGFQWAGFAGPWIVDGITAEECNFGLHYWENVRADFLSRISAVGCGTSVLFGAYENRTIMADLELDAPFELHASASRPESNQGNPQPTQQQSISGARIKTTEPHAFVIKGSFAESKVPTLIIDCDFEATAEKVFIEPNDNYRAWDFVAVTDSQNLEPSDFRVSSGRVSIAEQSWDLRVQKTDGTAWHMGPDGVVTSIDPFQIVVFWDVPEDHWAWRVIVAVTTAGIAKGYPDGSFRPENAVTRAEMAAFLSRAVGLAVEPPSNKTFSDVPTDHWALAVIEAVAAAGIAKGYPDGTYRPENQVTRAEMAAFLIRALGESTSGVYQGFFPDVDKGAWYTPSVERLAELGLVKGYPDGTFRPDSAVTRAETAAFLQRAWNLPLPVA